MKTHLSLTLVGALIFGMAAAAVCAPAEAASSVKSSKSNTSDRAITDAADEAKCITDGGTVVVRDGKKICSLPAAAQ